jgi:hypothetical protein
MAAPALLVDGVIVPLTGLIQAVGNIRATPLPAGSAAPYMLDFGGATTASDDVGGGAVPVHGATHYDTDPLDVDLIPAPDGFDAGKLRFEIDGAVAVYYDPAEKRVMLPAGGSIILLPDGPDGGSINVAGVQAVHMSVDHVTVYGDGSGVGIYLQSPIEWAGGDDPFVQLPADYPMVPNLDAEFLGGEDGAFYRNASNLNAGLVALARGGTGVDGSGQAVNLVFASPASGGAGAAAFRALVAGDIPDLDAAKIASGTLPKARQHPQTPYLDAANLFAALATFGAGLAVTGGNNNTGRIWKDAADGFAVRGVAGTTHSFRIVNELNQTILAIPVGSQAASFPGNLSTGGTFGATGVATFGTTASFGGMITAGGGLAVSGGASGAGRAWSDAVAGLSLRGITGSAYCFQLVNDANAAVLRVAAGGTQVQTVGALQVGTDLTLVAPTTAAGATAGAASLPAGPVGFIVVNIAGTNRKIPYYAT